MNMSMRVSKEIRFLEARYILFPLRHKLLEPGIYIKAYNDT